jgi:ribosomal protein S18 acetylase RimI-like enzyme
MVLIERATLGDRGDVEQLITTYHTSEGLRPDREKITWTVEQLLQNQSAGLVLVAREKTMIAGVALAAYLPSAEFGRTLMIQDFFVDPAFRRRGIGRALAARLMEEAKAMKIEQISLEILPTNEMAAAFWRSVGFLKSDRTLYNLDLA